tara:strand:+ start:8591 stop:9532 length:942 start_codon:yes stop_codon:yes gene_type:complete
VKIIVVGDYLIDRYRFYKQTRTDPANDNAPVVELLEEKSVNGGAGNLVRNIESLCGKEVQFFYTGCFDELPPGWIDHPTKVRHYVDDRFFLREDVNDGVGYDESVIDRCIDSIEHGDFVIVSDYHKGTIKKSDVVRIREECHLKGAISFVDTNHIWDSHNNIDWLKVNLKTAQDFMKVEYRNGDSTMISKDIFEKTGSNVIVTLGDKGCVAYIKELGVNVIFTKDKDNNFIDSIGAGDSFLAGFVSYMARWQGEAYLPALVYGDIVAHLSTQQLGTIDVVSKSMSDEIYRNTKTNIVKGTGGKLYVHRSIDNV